MYLLKIKGGGVPDQYLKSFNVSSDKVEAELTSVKSEAHEFSDYQMAKGVRFCLGCGKLNYQSLTIHSQLHG